MMMVLFVLLSPRNTLQLLVLSWLPESTTRFPKELLELQNAYLARLPGAGTSWKAARLDNVNVGRKLSARRRLGVYG